MLKHNQKVIELYCVMEDRKILNNDWNNCYINEKQAINLKELLAYHHPECKWSVQKIKFLVEVVE